MVAVVPISPVSIRFHIGVAQQEEFRLDRATGRVIWFQSVFTSE